MRTRRDFLTALLAVGATGLLAACSGGGAQSPSQPTPTAAAKPPGGSTASTATPAQASKPATTGGSITFVLENDVINFDPLLSRAFVDRNVHYQIYDSLVRVDPKGKIIPWLAERWETAPDGRQVTFFLRKDAKYHDGSPFDAESVKWNIDRYRTTKGSQRSGELAPIDTVEVVDAATVRFNLKGPYSPLLANLVDRAGMMVSRKAAEAGGENFTVKAFRAGTGPFILTEAVKDDHITLERNPEWWGKDKDGNRLPYLDKIVVRPFTDPTVRFTNLRTGDAQVTNNIAAKDIGAAKGDGSLVYQEIAGLRWDSWIPNRKAGFVFEEGRYVKAVSLAADRQEIQDKAFLNLGSVGYGAIAPSHFAFDPNFKPFPKADPEGAKRLVQEVGKGPLTFELLVRPGDAVELQVAQLFQAQLKKADIGVELVQLEFAQILDQMTKKAFSGMTQVGWSGRIDPDGNVYDHVYTERPNNDASYSNKEVDRLLDEQRLTNDEAKRREAIRKAEQIYAADDMARIWYRFHATQLVTAKRLQGLEPYPDQIIRLQFASLQK
jgi:peptide/nickel transport system substrate-binding protein